MYWGVGQHEDDPLLGSVLRIRLNRGNSPGETDVLVSEKEWTGRIEPDTRYGGDFCFIPGQGSRAGSDRNGG
jgi:hypothetical protein